MAWPVNPISLIADGDSLVVGFMASVSHVAQAVTSFPGGYGVVNNIAVTGQTLATMNTNRAANVNPLITTAHGNAQKAVVTCDGGTNDIAGGASAATLFSTATSYFQGLKTSGADFCVAYTILPRGDGDESIRLAYNANLRANFASIGIDVLLDWGEDPNIGAFPAILNTVTYNTDQTHLTTVGQDLAANLYLAAVGSIGSTVTVTGVTAQIGGLAGGMTVTITGTNFTGASVVIVGGVQVSSFVVVSSTTITAVVASAAAYGNTGPGLVAVFATGGAGVLNQGWTWEGVTRGYRNQPLSTPVRIARPGG